MEQLRRKKKRVNRYGAKGATVDRSRTTWARARGCAGDRKGKRSKN